MRTTSALVCLALALPSAVAFHLPSMTMSAGRFSSAETLRPFKEGRAFKVIAGITNFDQHHVAKVARAAGAGGATHLDVACDPQLVAIAKAAAPGIKVVVSAIDPEAFGPCVEAGADMLELGNFDSFYDAGLRLTSLDILDMTSRTQALHPTLPLSVTVPHWLQMEEQAQLADSLQGLGVDVIQTEGSPSVRNLSQGPQAWIERAAPALAASYVLARAAPKAFVMASSGLSEVTAPMALAAGACGVGVGQAVTKLPSEAEMAQRIQAIARAMGIDVEKGVQA